MDFYGLSLRPSVVKGLSVYFRDDIVKTQFRSSKYKKESFYKKKREEKLRIIQSVLQYVVTFFDLYAQMSGFRFSR